MFSCRCICCMMFALLCFVPLGSLSALVAGTALVSGTVFAASGGEALVGGAVAAAEVLPAAGWLLVCKEL